jgi:gentisate 1,2-dioxygenase
MRRLILVILLTMVALSAIAATKDTGTTVLKDVQPAGTTDKKHKHQQYDLSFASASGKDYTCRTAEKTSVKASDLVVGSSATYEVNGNKGKVKTAAGKKLSCTIVRVANVPTGTK